MLEIRGVTMEDSTHKNIHIASSGVIHSVSKMPFRDCHVINAEGLEAYPGIIDPHVHGRIPGNPEKENWYHLTRAAFQGGVTTVFDMPNTSPPLTTFERIDEKVKAIGECGVDSYFWFGATCDNAQEIRRASTHPKIIGVKVYMARTTGNLLVSSDEDIEQVFRAAAESGLVVGVHAEDESLIVQNRSLIVGRDPTVADHCIIRDTETEVRAVGRALRIRRKTGARLYLCHISTPEAVELATQERDSSGNGVYVEVCPHYLWLTEEKLATGDGPFFKMNPALRTYEQMHKLRAYVCADEGFVDCIGSDHAPYLWAEKTHGKYDEIPSGVPGVETLGPLLYHFVASGHMSRKRFADLTSRNAARLFGLTKKGYIEPGSDADVILCNPKSVTNISHTAMHSRCGWTPYHDMSLRGEIQTVIKSGVIVEF